MGSGAKKVKETAYEKELARMAYSELKVYQTKMAPFRDKYIADMTGPTAVDESRVAGEVNADFAQMNQGAIQGDPSLGRNRSAIAAQPLSKAQGYAAVSGTQAVRDNRIEGMQAGLDMIRGDATTAQAGISNLAATSVKDAMAKQEEKIARSNAITSAAGTLAGAAAGMYANRTPKAPTQTKASDPMGFYRDPNN